MGEEIEMKKAEDPMEGSHNVSIGQDRNAPYGKMVTGDPQTSSQVLRHRKQSYHVNVPHHFHSIGEHRMASLSRVNFDIELDEVDSNSGNQEGGDDDDDAKSVDIELDPKGPVKMPPVHEREDFVYLIIGGSLLTLAAGYLNAVALLEAGTTATHVSGTTTKFASLMVNGEWKAMGNHAFVILPFLAGATASGVGVGSDKFVMGHRYGVFLLIVGALWLAGTLVLRETDKNNAGIALWAGAAGMQNAMCTSFSGAVVRTTHVTGMATDIGNVFGHWIRGKLFGPGDTPPDTWKLRVLIPQYLSFFTGGVIGTAIQREIGIDAAFVISGLMFVLGVVYIVTASMGVFDGFLEEEIIEHEMEVVEQQFHAALHTAYHSTDHHPGIDYHHAGAVSRQHSHHSHHSIPAMQAHLHPVRRADSHGDSQRSQTSQVPAPKPGAPME
eukprot:TRINITY_DN32474_c0_g1_i1.p1 TRINITY_DN32474_c0_g1~~TRINITY_DN32474_c0_g1_i1.p1  ORF type:complete len:458 (+),score=182.63 TRINITY_DN32474_c0_g1_i1:57-1376(+)